MIKDSGRYRKKVRKEERDERERERGGGRKREIESESGEIGRGGKTCRMVC